MNRGSLGSKVAELRLNPPVGMPTSLLYPREEKTISITFSTAAFAKLPVLMLFGNNEQDPGNSCMVACTAPAQPAAPVIV